MFLKSVTMQGFKSFANRTKIELDKTTTAIVGPNGSGKSNITDAITWVLGESSAKNLRGAKMEDVIFSGTDSKKPLGMAEVTILFDNSDKSLNLPYNEVSVTRRMYRSLESEFLINNKKCRLKDIKELFMDTGIGKDGYSVIGQGKIESVLSSKPEDRRNIFEEAAGISKYKYKKVQSKNKLLKTEENLIRIEDILSEIESQEKNLRVQAEKAEAYLKDYEELKIYDINYSCKDMKKREEDLTNKIEELEVLKEDSKKILINRESLSQNLEEIQEKLEKLKEEDEVSSEKLRLYKEEFDKLNLEINLDEEKINSLKKDIERIGLENENLDKDLLGLKESLEEIGKDREVLNKSKEGILEKLTTKDSVIKNLEAEFKNLEEVGNLNFENKNKVKNEIENIKFKSKTLRDIIEEKNNRKSNLDKSIENLKENQAEFSKIIDRDSLELKTLKENLEKDDQEFEKTKESLLKLDEENKNLENKLIGRKNEGNEILARLKILENMELNYEGYNRTVKSFMNFSSKNDIFKDSLYGPVAEKFYVEKEFEKAISVALGSMSQNIIVSSTKDTSEMLKILEKNKMGRATFLPLDRVSGNKVKINSKEDGMVGLACDLIKFDEVFKGIFYNLLGRVIIADNFKNASRISKKHRLKVVTLKGEVFNPSGAITGGSLNNYNSSFILRKNEITDFQNKFKDLQGQIKKIESEKNHLEEKISELNEFAESYMEKRNAVNFKISNLESNIYKNKNDKDLNSEYLNKYLREKEELEKNIEADLKTLDNNKHEIENKNKLLEDLLNEVDSGDRLAGLSKEIEGLKTEKIEIQLLERENREKILYKTREIDRINSDLSLTGEKLDNNKKLLMEAQRNIEEKKKSNEKNKNSLEEIRKSIESLKNHLEEVKKDLEENNKSYLDKREEFSDLKEKSLVISSEIEKTELKIEMNRNKISNEVERLKEDYEVEDYHEFIDESLKDLKEGALRRLKKKVRDYGEVNISSIEEYRIVKERFDFYTSQRDDLIQSKEEIKSILSKLDQEMKKLFNEAMEEISGNFTEIFKILFNGGRAEISIEGDVLESGIEIKASPPGKRLQSLSLLSGGERSLTAVALLFALLKYRPASFCILDEIDAALDDANIKRYADYLLTLEGIQFIIITHRKLTMEIAKTMYGVTMEEKGISKLFSVKLKD
ncbi:MAG: chromosome segregation protein SMC [Peptoniphilus harei]|uniref:chromosome segregation protein SMC n=1 Tax=Peptoniphilus harei TaxID=54005 RepID=UPI00290635FE|nr:chromosome segregation protein SMC [Peptoniphilus harei]MDU5471517.1 chromosome segregation protein SMC [Peptoniphilus harei]MDU6099159.1 chromosome segregation protein SMC [Peptoniphilus harei]